MKLKINESVLISVSILLLLGIAVYGSFSYLPTGHAVYSQLDNTCKNYFGDDICDDSPEDCGSNYKSSVSLGSCDECQTFKDGKIGFDKCAGSSEQSAAIAAEDASVKQPIQSPSETCSKTDGDSYCGTKSAGSCYCDSSCIKYGDCCSDYKEICVDPKQATQPVIEPSSGELEDNHATFIGDFDGNGCIDFDDFFLFADAFDTSNLLYDLSKNGKVDYDDFFIFADSFGNGCKEKMQEILEENTGNQLTEESTESAELPEGESPDSPYIQPNEYATIKGCDPFIGDSSAPLKIVFVKIGDASNYDEIVADAINNQFKAISPFKENFNKMAVYSVKIKKNEIECENTGPFLATSAFVCNDQEVYEEVLKQCQIDDTRGVITIALAESVTQGGSGGDIIYLSSDSSVDLETDLYFKKNDIVHEIGHNFGLTDLYYGTLYFNGQPSKVGPIETATVFLNVDGPGCKKWCSSFKPVSEYTQSISSQCLQFSNKEECVSFGREKKGFCKYTDGFPDCCVWSDDKFEYFNTNCVPAIGSENIGIGCYKDSGCYFGAEYGNYAWRPNWKKTESIMHFAGAVKFDSVSERELSKVFNCCLSPNSASQECKSFRKFYSDFLKNYNAKKRVGSCGYIAVEPVAQKEAAPKTGSCVDSCYGMSKTGNCFCENSCEKFKTCCTDYHQVCG